jgi:hypothetical protein
MPLMSVSAYGRHRGVSHVAVLKAIKTGRIHREPDGRIDSDVADREWTANTNQAKPLNSISGDPKHRRAPDGLPQPTLGTRSESGNGSGRVAGSYASARAAREVVELQIRRIELKRLEGTLVDAESVRQSAFNQARAARNLLVAIPDRIAAIVAGLDNAAACHKVIDDEVRRVCDELSGAPTVEIPEREEGESEKA